MNIIKYITYALFTISLHLYVPIISFIVVLKSYIQVNVRNRRSVSNKIIHRLY